VTVSSSGMVNLNTRRRGADVPLGRVDLAEAGPIDAKTADEIIAYRQDHPFTTASQIGNVSPFLRDLYARTLIRNMVDVPIDVLSTRARPGTSGDRPTIDAIGMRVGNEIQWRFWRIE